MTDAATPTPPPATDSAGVTYVEKTRPLKLWLKADDTLFLAAARSFPYTAVAWGLAVAALLLVPYLELSLLRHRRGGMGVPLWTIAVWFALFYGLGTAFFRRRRQRRSYTPPSRETVTDFVRFDDDTISAGQRGMSWATWHVSIVRTFELTPKSIDIDVVGQVLRLRLTAMTQEQVRQIRQWLVKRVPKAAKCDGCGYNLQGSESIDCPECGVAVQGVERIHADRH
jgi:hypothetical protein